MDPVLKVKAEKHGTKNVLKLGNDLSYSRTVQEKKQTLLFVKLTSLVHIACKLVRNEDLLHPTTRQMSKLSESQNFS